MKKRMTDLLFCEQICDMLFYFCSPLVKSKNTWGDTAPPPTAVTSELWGAPMTKSRGPPPGLAKGTSNISLANGWSSASVGGGRGVSSWGTQGSTGNWGSPWLLLRNLTAQVRMFGFFFLQHHV